MAQEIENNCSLKSHDNIRFREVTLLQPDRNSKSWSRSSQHYVVNLKDITVSLLSTVCMRDEVCSLRQSYQMARMYRASTSGRVSRGLAVKSSAQSAETRLTVHIHHRHLLLLLRAPRPASLSTHTIAIYCYYSERPDPPHCPHTPSPFIAITQSAETRLTVHTHHRHLLLLLRAPRPASLSTYTIAIYCYYSERRDPPHCLRTPSPFIAITQSAETRLTLTLVCVVAMFLLLVTPSELINLYFYAAKSTVTFPATGCYCVDRPPRRCRRYRVVSCACCVSPE